jgi:hypothetical protein
LRSLTRNSLNGLKGSWRLSICAGLYFGKNDPNGDLRIQYMLMHTDFFRIKELFNKYPNVKNCLSGHIHLEDEVDYNNIKYFCNTKSP